MISSIFKKILNSCFLANKRIVYQYFVILFLFFIPFLALQAQNKPKQLKEEILKAQKESEKPPKVKKKELTKPTTTLPPLKPVAPIANPLENKNATLIYLENSEIASFDKFQNPDIQVLKGNVIFRHENALMYCDSAYFYPNSNSLDAFGNIRMVQGDTIFIYGNFLYYDGNTKLARLRKNVRMENRKTVLTTDSMNYDRMMNLAYYYTGGKIQDELNTLTSIWGQYSPVTNEAIFKNKVHLENENFIMDADTLKYNTKTNIANIVGKTHVIYKNETDIYSTRGWYNTANDRSMLLDRSIVKQKNGKSLIGDTIFYDKRQKYGEAFQHVILKDTVEKTSLFGNYVSYNENSEKGLATDSALLVDWSSKDSLFLHADTLKTYKDSIYNMANGYYHVRFFRNDLQGVCDSIFYSGRDSIIYLYGEPILWSEDYQITGDFVQAFLKNKKIDRVVIQLSAMAIQKHDSIHFNQLSGKEIIAYLDSNQIKKIDIKGNAETLYYPIDSKDSTIIGQNKTQSSYVTVYMKDKKVDRIVLTPASSGIIYPLEKLSEKDLYLKNYIWLPHLRPLKSTDVFLSSPYESRRKPHSSNAEKNVSFSNAPNTNLEKKDNAIKGKKDTNLQ